MSVDFHTLVFTAAVVSLLMALSQLLAWLYAGADRALAVWAGINLACAGSFGVQAVPGLPPPLLLAIANMLFVGAAGCSYLGLRAFDALPLTRRMWLLVAASCLATFAASYIHASAATPRIIVFSLAEAIWLAATTAQLAEVPPGGSRTVRRVMAVSVGAITGVHLVRLMLALGGAYDHMELPPPQQLSWTLLFFFVSGIGLNFGALFLALDRIASQDELTGLVNRRALLRSGERMVQAAAAHRTPLSLLLVDLDHFKSVNDRFGHQVGDLVLRAFAQTARGAVRRHDLVGRYGGEEFCIVLPGASVFVATQVAERLRTMVAERLDTVMGHGTAVTAAIGVASLDPERSRDIAILDLIDAADRALYAAKAEGRNRVVVAPPLHAQAVMHPRAEAAAP